MKSAGSGEPSIGARMVSRTREVDDVSFRAFLANRRSPRVAWTTPGCLELVGVGAAARLTAAGPDRFDALRERAASVFDRIDHEGPDTTRPRMVGGLAFDPDTPGEPWVGFPASAFVLPRVQLTRAGETTWLTATDSPDAVGRTLQRASERVGDLPAMCSAGAPPGVAGTRWHVPREEWMAGVERAVERVRAGELEKVVLATALDVDLATPVDVTDVLERLRRTYPSCYRFLVQPGERAFLGPPPERLVRKRGSAVDTEALAGSVARGETPAEDADLARSLLASRKLEHEQALVVDAIRDRLEPIGEVTVGERGVRKLTNIQHLETPIEARLDREAHVLDIVGRLHPTPAVGGIPPGRACEVIAETEPFERGWYAAPVGWFDAAGNGEFAVAIRSAVADGDRVTLFAGNGIVANSDPDEEWAEVKPKFRPVLDELERASDADSTPTDDQ